MEQELVDDAPVVVSNSDDELRRLKASWRAGQPWQCRQAGQGWRDLPLAHPPGWFYDTQYRLNPGRMAA